MKLIGGYTEEMRESIEKVEKTRDKRMKMEFEAMSMAERDEVLNKYHPDYKPELKRAVAFGPNTGEIAPNEVVDLLEAHPLITEKEIDLTKIDYDVDLLIIGGGGGGTVAALWANDNGIPVENMLMVTKLRHGDANSMMAQGGIQAAGASAEDDYMGVGLSHRMPAVSPARSKAFAVPTGRSSGSTEYRHRPR